MKVAPLLLVTCGGLTAIACGGTKIITVNHPNLDGN